MAPSYADSYTRHVNPIFGLIPRKFAPPLIRIFLWLIFALVTYSSVYQPSRANNTYAWDYYAEAAIRAANQGHPFYYVFANASATDPNGSLIRFDETRYIESGIPILLSSASVIKEVLTGNATLTLDAVYTVVFALFLAAGFLFVLPSVPLLVSTAGIFTLTISLFFGIISFSFAQSWATTFMAILMGMWVVTSLSYHRSRWQVVYNVGAGLLVGYMTIVRQESTLLVYATIAAMIVSLIGVTMSIWRTTPGEWRHYLLPDLRRIALSALLFFGAIWTLPLLVRGMLSIAWQTPFAETLLQTHGAGHPLYLGLGYTTNPYNIAWLDALGATHGELIAHQVVFGAEPYQGLLLQEWIQIVLHDPGILIQNIVAKLPEMRFWLNSPSALLPSQTGFSPLTARLADPLFFLFIPAFISCLSLFIIRNRPEYWIVGISASALLAAGLFSPLVIHPAYVFALRGALVTITFVFPAALLAIRRDTWGQIPMQARIRASRLLLLVSLVSLVVGIVLAGAWWFLSERELQEQVATLQASDAAVQLQSEEFRFDYTFNRMRIDEQRVVIDQLEQNTPQLPIFVPSGGSDDDTLEVVLAVFTEHQLHVIVHLPEISDPQRNHTNLYGAINAYHSLIVCVDCTVSPTDDENSILLETSANPETIVYHAVNDNFWGENQYRIFSFRATPMLRAADDLLLALQYTGINSPEKIVSIRHLTRVSKVSTSGMP